ncbi:MAG: hypothetical protein ABL889_22720 [Terricaulis sp.]
MKANGPHDAIAPEALPAIQALEGERGTRDDFDAADAELQRLQCRWDLRTLAGMLAGMAVPIALGTFERPYNYAALVPVLIAVGVFEVWWARTPRARAIKRVKQAVHDWLAFGQTAPGA